MDHGPTVKHKTTFRNNNRKKITEMQLGKNFLELSLKVQSIKEKPDILDLNKINPQICQNILLRREKGKPQTKRKYLQTIYPTNKGLIFRIL